MLNGVVPEGVGSTAGVEIGASQFHNSAYGALGDAVDPKSFPESVTVRQ